MSNTVYITSVTHKQVILGTLKKLRGGRRYVCVYECVGCVCMSVWGVCVVVVCECVYEYMVYMYECVMCV